MTCSTEFFVKIYFFNKDREKRERYILDRKRSKLIIELKYDFIHDLLDNKNTLSIIKTYIKEELEKNNDDINFNTDFIKIEVGYITEHYPMFYKQAIKKYRENSKLLYPK